MGYRPIPYYVHASRNIGKQCGPRTDDVMSGVGCRSTRFALYTGISKIIIIKKHIVIIKTNQTPLLLEKDLPK